MPFRLLSHHLLAFLHDSLINRISARNLLMVGIGKIKHISIILSRYKFSGANTVCCQKCITFPHSSFDFLFPSHHMLLLPKPPYTLFLTVVAVTYSGNFFPKNLSHRVIMLFAHFLLTENSFLLPQDL